MFESNVFRIYVISNAIIYSFLIFLFRILDTETWHLKGQFNCVCMLNLLDRCNKPKTMLRQAKDSLTPDGVLMIALVLPYKPYVEGELTYIGYKTYLEIR